MVLAEIIVGSVVVVFADNPGHFVTADVLVDIVVLAELDDVPDVD